MAATYLPLTACAWARLRRAWRLPATAPLLRQAFLYGPLRSFLAALQSLRVGSADVEDADAIFVLGFWRSGTTLMHELLAADERFCFPSNYAVFHPDHFVFTEKAALARGDGEVRRPQDGMTTGWGTPQEDEFALLALGARSPYEGLIAAADFGRAMMLADPDDLPTPDRKRWERVFLRFFRAVRFAHGGKAMVLKSPTHSYRVRTLRKLLPRARFILMVRDPSEVFESMMKTYRAFTLRYGLVPGMPNRELRELVLQERLRCEEKLLAGLAGLGKDRLAVVKFEELTADPVAVTENIYRQFALGDFETVRPSLIERAGRGGGSGRAAALPPPPWQERLRTAWSDIFNRYGYQPR
ncbi:MAG TPA: sulfotransferase [Rhizomicrobium sp.]|nr:sulfotransferase [Rhizomicrobium sp.]